MSLTRASVAVIGAVAVAGTIATGASPLREPKPQTRQTGLGAVFEHRSYRPGATARLDVWFRSRPVRLQLFQAGPERHYSRRNDEMSGVARSAPITIGTRARSLVVHLGADWQSGLYFARLVARDGRVGFAPFVLRPLRLGTSRVAVVLPTNTWAAYNFLDVDGNGVGDTWYADPSIHVVDLRRPFSRRGVPPHFRAYDAGFLEWLAKNHLHPDVLSDDDLERIHDGRTLARLYDLIVFSGHEEYVTPHEFNVVSRYRDLGGNLAFLSANNFFYRVVRRGHTIVGRTKFRDLGRPEAALVGVQYVNWFQNRYRNRPYVVVGTQRAPWLFAGSGLRDGSRFGNYGIEIDARAPSSPPSLRVLARIPNIFGPGQSAEMTYYKTRAGAKVFAAGTINFGGTALFPQPSRLLRNLWRRLSVP